jgi:predicted nucleotidyltransferase
MEQQDATETGFGNRHWLVERHTIYSCVVGSRAYGLGTDASDVDRRGVYAAPTALFWHLEKPPTHVDGPAEEQFSWEVERFCQLALASNPTVLECLWSPLVERATPWGRELLALRTAFLSSRVGPAYGGYAKDQLARLTATRERTGEVRWKQAMHMIRLLLAGAHVLRTGEVLVDVSEHRDRLLAVRRGELTFVEFGDWAARATEDFDMAAAHTTLPDAPNRAAIDDFLTRLRRDGLAEDGPPEDGLAEMEVP